MYKVLLVDDEPIVLSGIKFLIDWTKNNCEIINTARNGQQALEVIEREHPDIVLCDINIPVMSGIEVLKALCDKENSPIFIMLTNHQEFDLAREALRYKALDYLLKTQLEPDTLERAVQKAIFECEKRSKIKRMDTVSEAIVLNKSRLISSNFQILLEGDVPEKEGYCCEVLDQHEVLNQFFLAEISMEYPNTFDHDGSTDQDMQRVYECIQEMTGALLAKVFKDFSMTQIDNRRDCLYLLVWNVQEEEQKDKVKQFFLKLLSSSSTVAATKVSMLITKVFSMEQGMHDALEELHQMQEYQYAYQQEILFYEDMQPVNYENIDIKNYNNKLIFEIRSKNIQQVKECLDKIEEKLILNTHHSKDEIKACTELFCTTSTVMTSFEEEGASNDYFTNTSQMIHKLNRFTSKKQLKDWFMVFEHQVIGQLEQLTSSRSELLEKVTRYILENVDKRIMLQDVASYVSISPSYLSALFKKQYNQNLIDYINKVKMEKACELIRKGKYRIYEISYMLSIENAYYFTKVFKRHIGMTPKEYQYKVQGKDKTEKQ